MSAPELPVSKEREEVMVALENTTEYKLGALAQAVRNYVITGYAEDLRILDRLASEASGRAPIGDVGGAFAERER